MTFAKGGDVRVRSVLAVVVDAVEDNGGGGRGLVALTARDDDDDDIEAWYAAW